MNLNRSKQSILQNYKTSTTFLLKKSDSESVQTIKIRKV